MGKRTGRGGTGATGPAAADPTAAGRARRTRPGAAADRGVPCRAPTPFPHASSRPRVGRPARRRRTAGELGTGRRRRICAPPPGRPLARGDAEDPGAGRPRRAASGRRADRHPGVPGPAVRPRFGPRTGSRRRNPPVARRSAAGDLEGRQAGPHRGRRGRRERPVRRARCRLQSRPRVFASGPRGRLQRRKNRPPRHPPSTPPPGTPPPTGWRAPSPAVTDVQTELATAGGLDVAGLNAVADGLLDDLAADDGLFSALAANAHGATYPHRHGVHAAMLAAAAGAARPGWTGRGCGNWPSACSSTTRGCSAWIAPVTNTPGRCRGTPFWRSRSTPSKPSTNWRTCGPSRPGRRSWRTRFTSAATAPATPAGGPRCITPLGEAGGRRGRLCGPGRPPPVPAGAGPPPRDDARAA